MVVVKSKLEYGRIMKNSIRFKKRYVLLLLIVIIFGPKLYRYTNYELTKNDLIITEPEKIEYSDLAELEEYLYSLDYYYILSSDLNNIAYTIKEDNLEDWYKDFVYNYQYRDFAIIKLWFAYDLAINDQYCHTKVIDDEDCYVSDTETKNPGTLVDANITAVSAKYGVVILESSTKGNIFYDSARSEELIGFIDDAQIVIQGSDTPGYNKALDRLFSSYKNNDGHLDKEKFEFYFISDMTEYNEELTEMKDLETEQLFYEYSTYQYVIKRLTIELNYSSKNNPMKD